MPQIEEDVLVGLYDQIAHLEEENKTLKKEFIGLKIKLDKSRGNNVFGKKLILVLALLLIVLSIVFFIIYNKGNHVKGSAHTQHPLQQNISIPINESQTDSVVFSVQLGVYEKIDIAFDESEVNLLKKIPTKNGNAFQLGRFTSYKKAAQFKQDLIKIGFKAPFIVAYYQQKKISVKKAIALSEK